MGVGVFPPGLRRSNRFDSIFVIFRWICFLGRIVLQGWAPRSLGSFGSSTFSSQGCLLCFLFSLLNLFLSKFLASLEFAATRSSDKLEYFLDQNRVIAIQGTKWITKHQKPETYLLLIFSPFSSTKSSLHFSGRLQAFVPFELDSAIAPNRL